MSQTLLLLAPFLTLEAIITSPAVVQESTGRRILWVRSQFDLLPQVTNTTPLVHGMSSSLAQASLMGTPDTTNWAPNRRRFFAMMHPVTESLLLVRTSSSGMGVGFITVPKLYAMYRIPSNGHLCLIMERLDAETLEALWPVLDKAEKSIVCGRLKDVFTTIRRIPIPQSQFYGSVERSPVPHHLFYSPDSDSAICGPFESESRLNAALVRKLRAIWAENKKHSFKADFYRTETWTPS
ncbi:hypothetical protein LZ554_001679 [Drepanopeziza brunnea f. sp. 'monogermtubi']|nr:hypothetical protein LZ554_001679 [Drepanopeziza brunnea f. sp. 'monogermtubi']